MSGRKVVRLPVRYTPPPEDPDAEWRAIEAMLARRARWRTVWALVLQVLGPLAGVAVVVALLWTEPAAAEAIRPGEVDRPAPPWVPPCD